MQDIKQSVQQVYFTKHILHEQTIVHTKCYSQTIVYPNCLYVFDQYYMVRVILTFLRKTWPACATPVQIEIMTVHTENSNLLTAHSLVLVLSAITQCGAFPISLASTLQSVPVQASAIYLLV